MTTVSVEELESHLSEYIDKLTPGEILVITRENRPVATLTTPQQSPGRRQPGSAKGILEIICDDEKHLEDFREYMP